MAAASVGDAPRALNDELVNEIEGYIREDGREPRPRWVLVYWPCPAHAALESEMPDNKTLASAAVEWEKCAAGGGKGACTFSYERRPQPGFP